MFKFLKKIFEKTEEEEIEPISAADWVSEYSQNLTSEKSGKLSALLEKINSEAEQVKEKADKLLGEELANKNIPQRVISIMEGNRTNYVKRLKLFMDNTLIEDEQNADSEKFQKEFENFSSATKKAYYILKDFFYNSLIGIVGSLKTLDNLHKELGELLGGEKHQEFGRLKEELNEYNKDLIEKNRAKEDINFAKKDIKDLEEKISGLKKKKEGLKLSSEYARFKRIYEQKENVLVKIKKNKDAFLNSFYPIITALKKYKRTSLKERLIEKYLEDPFSAVLSDVNLEFDDTLKKLEEAVKNKEIEINEKKRGKILISIQNLLRSGLLSKCAYEHKELQAQKNELDEKLNKNKIMNDISELDYKIEHLENKDENIKLKLKEAEEKVASMNLDGKKKKLEEELSEFARRKVMIT